MNAPQINQNKTVSKVNFSIIHLVIVYEHTSLIIQTHYTWMTSLFISAKVILDRMPQNAFSKSNAPSVLLSLVLTHPFLNGCLFGVCFLGFMHSSSFWLVLCSHLSPTALNSNLPYWKMDNFGKALNAKSTFIGLKLFHQSGPAVYFSPRNGLKYANVNER